ncbi:electron transfer flavoprotein subunit alpha/FixB family protein [Immundisolibacter cernigliae]|uniref:Electron transfer flavoprotein subunit alpha n=1 Tax=Immundisolibacter cernigliae TaxID=1810504 RepID=A0A1B1YRF7_9GAMM|nr:FAD-binding protein [Immundisolibacter cernigliae]ANX03343.1 electron transfer flavoprotein subunit beta [Immundisolibacter cernigliae]
MAKVLLIAEHDGTKLNAGTAKVLACCADLGAEGVDVLVSGADGAGLDGVCAQAAALAGVSRVLRNADARNAAPLAAILAPQIADLAAGYGYVLGPSTTFGKDLLPRVAALLGAPALSDIMKVLGPRSFERPIYAGNAILTVSVPDGAPVVGTVRVASYKAVGEQAPAPVEAVSSSAELPGHTRFVELRAGSRDRPDLQSANKVVSGGRGVGSSENFRLIFELADKLGAAAGASRAAVDAGFVPNDMQVGQTGKVVAPELYIAVGISGAIQHLAGIKDAGTIVAVNKDADAPIFEVADIGLVADLFEAVPALVKALP